MAQKQCSACGGSGRTLGTETYTDMSGGYIYKTRSVMKPCSFCNGTGSVWAPDPPPKRSPAPHQSGSRNQTPPARRRGRSKRDSFPSTLSPEEAALWKEKEKEKKFRKLVAMTIFAGMGYLLFTSGPAWAWWVKILVSGILALVSEAIVTRHTKGKPALRILATLVFAALAVVVWAALFAGCVTYMKNQ